MDPQTPQAVPSARFHGRFRQKIDEKGRVSLPALFRRAIPREGSEDNGTLILIKGPEGYLQAFSVQEWEERIERLNAASTAKGAEARWRRRALFGSVAPLSLDDKGRCTIPRQLLEEVGIGHECLILGVDRAIEIWDPARFFELEAAQHLDLSDVEDILF
jgi:MraZ protein